MARLQHEVFHILSGLNSAIRELLHELNRKPIQRLPGNRQKLFESLDKPELAPLPPVAWEYTDTRMAKVGIDYHVLYQEHFYSVPHSFAGKAVEVHASQRLLRIYYQRECIAQHPRSERKGGFTCVDEHMLSHHQHQKWSPGRLNSATIDRVSQNTSDRVICNTHSVRSFMFLVIIHVKTVKSFIVIVTN